MDKISWPLVAIFVVLLLLCVCICFVGGAGIWLYSFEGDNGVVVTLPPDLAPRDTATPPANEFDLPFSNQTIQALQKAADLFETHTYPTNREFFGSEWNPGVDNDPRLSILHARGLGNTVAGYFSSPDSYVRAVRPDSNEMEMFYINIQNVRLGDDFYNGVLAHEFQHMIHWNNDRNEETWLNEGCSELAMELNARTYHVPGTYHVGGSDYSYLQNPDTQLTTWPEGTAGSAAANYGGSYLFMAYFLDRFGEDTTRALVAHDANGMESFDLVLADEGLAITHKDLFADWVIANLLDEANVDEGQYHYPELRISKPRIDATHRTSNYPVERTTNVRQYGVDYIQVEGNAPLQFTFNGQSEVQLIDAEAYSGQYLWWSNREDESYTRLSRMVDLRNVNSAMLRFWAWYHIEEDWDYAYLAIGTTASGVIPADYNDASISWQILDDRTLNCTTSDPNGNSFGCGWTGQSNGWKQLGANLTPFVGQQVLISFQYITDAAVNQPGFAVDDVEIEAGERVIFSDDMESGVGDWVAEGFVRHANILPQEWIVQLVTYGPQTHVQRLLFADGNTGTWTIPLGNNILRAVIVVSAIAPMTTESATYNYALTTNHNTQSTVSPIQIPPLPPESNETLEALAAAQVPNSDLHELAIRFLGVPVNTPRQTSTTPDYPIGTRRTFNVSNVDTDAQFEITAILVYKTPHVYMWMEEP